MTTVTVSDSAIRAENHAGHTAVCISVTSRLQSAMHILNRGRALETADVTIDPPRFDIIAAVGDLPPAPDLTAGAMREYERLARQRSGRVAFVQAVFAGTWDSLVELRDFAPDALMLIDTRSAKPKEPTNAAAWRARQQQAFTHDPDLKKAHENLAYAEEA